MKPCLFAICLLHAFFGHAQMLGGNSVFNFLNISPTPQLTGLGGINVSQPSNDIGLAFYNPGLLNKNMHGQAQVVFQRYFAGINQYHLSYAHYHDKWKSSFSGGLVYLDYGSVPETDAAGNILGEFKPVDWVIQGSVARTYLEKWMYGASLKFIHSDYGQYSSTGLAADIGVVFRDTSKKLSASVVVKNLGTQLKAYPGTEKEELPFDLQAGITKRLQNAPFSFSLTAHHIHRFDILYNDTTGSLAPAKNNFVDKLFRHLVLAGTIHIGDRLEVQTGYNFLRRKELNAGQSDGLNGFSLAVGLILQQMQVRYAKTWYQQANGGNQLGLNLHLDKFFGW
jgi:hypothetical protein